MLTKQLLAAALTAVAMEAHRADHTPEPVRAKRPVQAAHPHSFADQRLRDRQRKLEKRSRR